MSKVAPIVSVPTSAPKVIKSKKPAPVVLTGHEKLVDVLAEKKSEIEAAEGVIDHSRKDLDPLVTNFRASRENDGEFTKSVQVKGSQVNAVYSFKESFKKINTSVEDELKRLLGQHYAELFDRKRAISIKEGSMEKLLLLAQKHGFVDLLEEDEYLIPADDFRRKRYEKRSVLTQDQNKILDDVVTQVANKPSLSFK